LTSATRPRASISAAEFKDADGNLLIQVGDEVDVYLDSMEKRGRRARPVQGEGRHDEGLGRDREGRRGRRQVVTGNVVARGSRAACPSTSASRPSCPARRSTCARSRTSTSSSARPSTSRSSSSTRSAATSSCPAASCSRRSARPSAGDHRDAEAGVIMTGVIKNITDYGAFVDLGGIDGLLAHHGHVVRPHPAPLRDVRGRRRASRSRSSSSTPTASASPRLQADPPRPVGGGRVQVPGRRHRPRQGRQRSPTTARSWSSRTASRAWSTSPR
jgi:hypothetical protein